ncbi:ribonuclease HII [Subtercola boreus]|uniref:Ribonuclease n=1 Tax=Subtercola boreus TaxID=120213 RepID=A0A3E0WBV2_9MICO|nr:ribonuclease HII [Subtercola boreus]RFA22027.1 ribonuclease HII [Subtercola boreus]RFA22207.1 ribonuclease HII [Subtercola boreus]RFA28069.1 ribonuclease HII [Subtercola boreus]
MTGDSGVVAVRAAKQRHSGVCDPSLRHERRLGRDGARLVIGVDEVGRGALAGPVAVGMCVIDPHRRGTFPAGLRDSKMLSEAKREQLAPLASAWASASAVGLASADEVDRLGIIACLGLAGARALAQLAALGVQTGGSVILLDGSHNWLATHVAHDARVVMRIKADRDCASVAAASVVAKVHRDRIMIELDTVAPGYSWARNKGYASAAHFEGLDLLGATDHHRRTWLKGERMLEGSGG